MKSILITGGSGSFGTAFTRHLLEDNLAERVCIFSRSEHCQAEMAKEFNNDLRLRFFIGDVRDRWRLCRAMEQCDVVVHAAALKRIEVGHYNPIEMVKTNINGAINVIEAAKDAKVGKVVALSTDKAFQPISPYGQSKAIAESLFRAANGPGTRFAVIRYGNVWKSAGSVVPKWQSDIARGAESVRVTDLACTRFFMLMREAVEVVLRTIDVMKGGELVIPDLPAYQLGDLIKALGVRAEVCGLPEYEKLHESLDGSRSSDKARRMTVEELRVAL